MTKIAEICDSIGEKMDKITDWKTLKVESLGFEYAGFNYEEYDDYGGEKVRVWSIYYSILINGIDTGYSLEHEHWGYCCDDYNLSCDEWLEECVDFTEVHEMVGKYLGMEMQQFEKFKYVNFETTGFPRITDVDLCIKTKPFGKLLTYKIRMDDGSSFIDTEKYDKDDYYPYRHRAEGYVKFLAGLEGRELNKVMGNLGMGDAI